VTSQVQTTISFGRGTAHVARTDRREDLIRSESAALQREALSKRRTDLGIALEQSAREILAHAKGDAKTDTTAGIERGSDWRERPGLAGGAIPAAFSTAANLFSASSCERAVTLLRNRRQSGPRPRLANLNQVPSLAWRTLPLPRGAVSSVPHCQRSIRSIRASLDGAATSSLFDSAKTNSRSLAKWHCGTLHTVRLLISAWILNYSSPTTLVDNDRAANGHQR
jgi:hypothetical protein